MVDASLGIEAAEEGALGQDRQQGGPAGVGVLFRHIFPKNARLRFRVILEDFHPRFLFLRQAKDERGGVRIMEREGAQRPMGRADRRRQ